MLHRSPSRARKIAVGICVILALVWFFGSLSGSPVLVETSPPQEPVPYPDPTPVPIDKPSPKETAEPKPAPKVVPEPTPVPTPEPMPTPESLPTPELMPTPELDTERSDKNKDDPSGTFFL